MIIINILQMDLLLLPKDVQNLIGEFNVEHRPKMLLVMDELVIKCEERIEKDKYCVNCGDDAEEQYSNYIFGINTHFVEDGVVMIQSITYVKPYEDEDKKMYILHLL